MTSFAIVLAAAPGLFGGADIGPAWSNIGHGAETGLHAGAHIGAVTEGQTAVSGGIDVASFEYNIDFGNGDPVSTDLTLTALELRAWWLPPTGDRVTFAAYIGAALTSARVELGPFSDEDQAIGFLGGLDFGVRTGGDAVIVLGGTLRTYGVTERGADSEIMTGSLYLGLRWLPLPSRASGEDEEGL